MYASPMTRRAIVFLGIIAATAVAGCSRAPSPFVDSNARAHVSMLAGTIGSRPVGTPANAKARAYIVDQLKQIGFDVRVQETDARRHELGITARVSNIIGILPGERTEALGLVSHYDSSPDAPGATDDALGVAVTLEAARVFAGGGKRKWSLFALITDGEESGLMGAAALVNDREVTDRLRSYVNLESIGSSGTAVLFETGPGNAWLVSPWARHAPHPRGASYGIEVYRRLPNDTDFSILKTRDIPGLNFAATGDSYAYHTARDTPERLSLATIRTTGENVVALLGALQDADITARSDVSPTFFDIGQTTAVSYGPLLSWTLSALALLTGVIAWVRVSSDAVRLNGVARWLLTVAWSWLGAAAVCASMVGATWLLRAAREVYHPWYARPGRLFLLLLAAGATAGWIMTRAGQWLPQRAHPARHPALTWSAALPAWILLAAAAIWTAPAAAYLWALPLLTAGVLMAVLPPSNDAAIRLGSFVVLAVSATLWLRETHDLLRFVVTIMGRLPIVTPVFIYAVLLSVAGVMVVPPLVALVAAERPLRRPWAVTALFLIAFAAAMGAAYLAPAYTAEQPLRRQVRALQEAEGSATWEIASVEPGLDVAAGAPVGWVPATGSTIPTSIPWGRYTFPFVFRTTGPALGAPPASVTAFTVTPLAEGSQLSLTIVPREPGLRVSFVLPADIVPARSTLPGVVRLGRWTAAYLAVPVDGLVWEASFRAAPPALQETRVAVTSTRFPGGSGWQGLPAWLPQERAVWSANATWVIPATQGAPIAPVPPLR